MTESLLNRAHRLEEWSEEHFLDPHNIFYTYLDKDTEGPVTDAFFAPDQKPLFTRICTPAEWHNYENCGMATAAYMMGLLCRYTVEKDPVALQRARKCFHALKYIYDMGRQLEEGFLPKVYGDRFSEETSTDQVLYAMLALDYFHQFAEPAEKTEVTRMITHLITFWSKRGYRYRYFWEENMLWPLGRFTCLLLMGYKYSGDESLKSEYDRLLAMGVNRAPLESRLQPKLQPDYVPLAYEREQHAWLLSEVDGAVSMEVMELDYLLLNDPRNSWASTWKLSVKTMWEEAKLAIAPDGLEYVHVLVDMDTRQARRPEPVFFKEPEQTPDKMDGWIGWRHVTGAKSCDGTFLARAIVQAYAHWRDPEMAATARRMLEAVDLNNMLSYHDPERHLPELRHRTRLISGDGMANWLWAYWQGRRDGVFPE